MGNSLSPEHKLLPVGWLLPPCRAQSRLQLLVANNGLFSRCTHSRQNLSYLQVSGNRIPYGQTCTLTPCLFQPPPSHGPEMPLTTLSSGTDRLSVHSWLFTKASVIEDENMRRHATHNSWQVIFGRGNHESTVIPAAHVTSTLEGRTCQVHTFWPRDCDV